MSNTFFDVWWTGNNTSSYANHIAKIQYIDENRYAERDGIIARWNTLLTYVVELDKLAGEPLDLYVNSRLIARGEAVRVGEKFGIKLTEVVSPSDRVERLG